MRRILLAGAAVIFLLSVGWRQVVRAQDLLIDEYGRVYVEYEGQVLGKESEGIYGNVGDKPTIPPAEPPATGPQIFSRSGGGTLPRERPEGNAAELRFRQEVQNATGVKRIEVKNGRLEVRLKPPKAEFEYETEDEGEATGGSQTVERVRLRQRAERHEVEIREAGGSLEIRQQFSRARTHFPLSIGPNNELIVTTPAGTKEVTILPDQAVAQMLKAGFLSSLSSPEGGVVPVDATVTPAPGEGEAGAETGELAVVGAGPTQEVQLTEDNGFLVYKVRGRKAAKLFGLVPVSSDVTANVSAETGVVVSMNQPWYFSTFGFLFRP